ncbi:MAG: membrane protein insertase YidC [Actinobacteria bacterium]|nr:membrane protein insertase YidC [Actinomycetota bacterium]
MIAGLFEAPAALLAWFYSFTHNYILAISLIALVVMVITAPLVLKSTKGMLEMQKLQPEMKKLQNQYRGDRQKLNEEMMKLYQEHKVNPMASCFPLLLQMPVFIIMFRVLHGLTTTGPDGTFAPQYISKSSELYKSLVGQTEMMAWGLDLSKRPYSMVGESFGQGLLYVGLVLALGLLYFVQQRMVASRAAVSPTVSPMQQKLMQYLPVAFAVFMGFYLTGLVIYYFAQAVFRIGLNYYITHRFYKHEDSLGRQAQRASESARELHKADKAAGGGGGLFAQAKRQAAETKAAQQPATTSKRVTPPKNKPTPPSKGTSSRPPSSGKAARPDTNNKKK